MKTCHILGPVSRKAGGLLEVVAGLSRWLIETQEVDSCALGAQDEFVSEDRVRWFPTKLVTAPVSPLFPKKFYFTPTLASHLDLERPDVCHCHGLWTYHAMMTMNWLKKSKAPLIVSPHGMLDAVDLQKSRLIKYLATTCYVRSLLERAFSVVALCNSEAESVRRFGVRKPICVIPNGVDFVAKRDKTPEWRIKIPKERNILFYIGRIHPKKGIANLLKGWKSALLRTNRNDRGNWHLVIAGWDQCGHEKKLKALANELDIIDSTDFVGPQFGENKAISFGSANAFVLTSTSEGLPTVVLEAWASGLPVIMTPECNIPEGFDLNAAIKVNSVSDDIAEGILQLFSMTEAERREMGNRGKEIVERRFSWPEVAKKMCSAYEWSLGGDKPDFVYGA